MKSQHKQAGFSSVELLIVLLVIVVLGTVGWTIAHHKHSPRQQLPLTTTQSSGLKTAPSTTSSGLSIKVTGNKLVDKNGKSVQLRGVNVSGGGDCIPVGKQPAGVLYPLTAASASQTVTAIANWDVNVVRITMNEDCWLGINEVNPAYSGANYRNTITNFVSLLNQHNIYVVIDMHTNAPGGIVSSSQQAMADADHATFFWQSVATTFKSNSGVLFEAYNEPHITGHNAQTTNPWQCWLSGCTITETDQNQNKPIAGSPAWQSAGMQQIVTAIRSTSVANPILLGGLNWSQDLSSFLTYLPKDPQNQLIAVYHNYMSATSRNSLSYWNGTIAPIADKMPIITTEMGEKDGGSQYNNAYMSWADAHNVSYIAWAWGPTNAYGRLGLISDFNGTPSSYGQAFYDHFKAVSQ